MRSADDRPPTPLGLDRPRVVAVLGPTNTGKTHLAVERMLGHRSGMIGFPLRLLARENYDRIVKLEGAASVALVTGEERILPKAPRWYVCTVEAMPLEREVAFLAVDEIQMAADRERGHVFTDRLLHARGYAETIFLGAETAKKLIRKLVREAEHIARPRFSTLTYSGARKITRLPHRSAVVDFSAAEVYRIAELVRRQRGGAAVVFGALSPRTRNAQVAMYQAGEVDYLVATDAIGMGLNMDIDHVAFAQVSKFDGRGPRRLSPAELAQIAGRAGRHMSNGTFGTTAELGTLEPALIEAIEDHRFAALEAFYWRNPDLDFSSPADLLASLERRPPSPELVRKRDAEDHQTLAVLASDPQIMALAAGRSAVKLLWEVCQIPDFRKALSDSHARLLAQIFRHLRVAGQLPQDWVARQVARLDNAEGDIDSLLQRIAHIRTWTYVSYRPAWLGAAAHWQERTRAVEDKLSDALHERLRQRFVDRRAAAAARKLGAGDELLAAVTREGEVLVEGQFVGRLQGFNFVADPGAREGARRLLAAANKALRRDVGERVRRLETDGEDRFALAEGGRILWRDSAVARLIPGETALAPRVETLPADLLEPQHREAIRRRLAAWLQGTLERHLEPLVRLGAAALEGPARGLAFELAAALGTVPRARVENQLAGLLKADRARLSALAVRLGAVAVFLPRLKRHDSVALRALLWSVFRGRPTPVPPQRPSFPADPSVPAEFHAACMYLPAGPLLVRADRLERLAAAARERARGGPFAATPELAALIGARPGDLAGVLAALGYRPVASGDGVAFVRRTGGRRAAGNRSKSTAFEGSPFAGLGRLVPG
ncbi:MAG: helicase-related protein [Pseudomonadota bacterium]